MDADPIALTADEDKLNLASILTLVGSFGLGIVLVVGVVHSVLSDLRAPFTGEQ
jgi:hypothetical protein